jgi:hypothetical protein
MRARPIWCLADPDYVGHYPPELVYSTSVPSTNPHPQLPFLARKRSASCSTSELRNLTGALSCLVSHERNINLAKQTDVVQCSTHSIACGRSLRFSICTSAC